ncbi:YppG family protein [Falsibacillus pallidus]|uniref:YppG-like protein n=1 Tax=Falsibacillus pallidus TaxID=493781 RepID=A0A370GKZ0_9BACI|nr:YppG family protein [Falsibacillus pallidus]RDI43034.1 YppG-like protein [Falsibacillus pallidus]
MRRLNGLQWDSPGMAQRLNQGRNPYQQPPAPLYPGQGPYMMPHPQYGPGSMPFPQQGNGANPYGQSAYYPYQQSSQIFQNPLQPPEPEMNLQQQSQGYANPYPKASFLQKPQGSPMSSVMNSFKGQDGNIDFNKMMNTAGQMMSAVNQVSSMVKGLGGMFKI